MLAYTHAAEFDAHILLFPARAYHTALAVLARRPLSLVHACTRAAAFDAMILQFLVLAERTALAVLARRPLSLVLAHTRASAFDAQIWPFPVLAFLVNLGLCHGGTKTATARDEQAPCF